MIRGLQRESQLLEVWQTAVKLQPSAAFSSTSYLMDIQAHSVTIAWSLCYMLIPQSLFQIILI